MNLLVTGGAPVGARLARDPVATPARSPVGARLARDRAGDIPFIPRLARD